MNDNGSNDDAIHDNDDSRDKDNETTTNDVDNADTDDIMAATINVLIII